MAMKEFNAAEWIKRWKGNEIRVRDEECARGSMAKLRQLQSQSLAIALELIDALRDCNVQPHQIEGMTGLRRVIEAANAIEE